MRTKIHPDELEAKKGKVITEGDYNVLIQRDTTVLKPNGQPLLVFLKSVVPAPITEACYPTLHGLKSLMTDNRGMASGSLRKPDYADDPKARTRAKSVSSAIIGAFDPNGPRTFCRLTAWTGKENEKFHELFPLFEFVGAQFKKHVPDRWANQMKAVGQTDPTWLVGNTPFSTITVNNTYPTGVHTDKGDLDEGFSCLTVMTRGAYTGGVLSFPEYRIAADIRHGDLILMDAHEWHGNTRIVPVHAAPNHEPGSEPDHCPGCVAERISVVCYFRTKMVGCGSADEETAKSIAAHERALITQSGGLLDDDTELLKEAVNLGG